VRTRVWIAIVVASLGWGSAGIATRAAFDQDLGPYTIVAMRTLMATLIIFAYRAVRRRPMPRDPRLWRLGAVLGTTNITVPYILITLAVQHASAGFVGLLITNIPLATAAWAHLLLPDEPLHRGKAAGLAVAAAGVGVLMASGDSGLGDGGNPGLAVVLALGAIVVAAFGGVHARRHAPDHDVLDLAAPQFLIGTGILIPLMLLIEGGPAGTGATGWGLLAYMALAGTFMPFLLFFWMLQRVSATKASLPGYVIPLVSLAGGALFLDEKITAAIAAGGALILLGVILTERAEATRRAVRPMPEAGA
jgi:drug/metabolite transporter (DMT)-like permease